MKTTIIPNSSNNGIFGALHSNADKGSMRFACRGKQTLCLTYGINQGRHFNFFLGGANFFSFFNATGLLKNWRKQHFIFSNLTLFIVPFFLSFFFSLFSLFFLFFFLFSFFFFLGGGGAPSSPPPQMRPLVLTGLNELFILFY